MTIVDEVRYENLEAGVEHVMVGTLIDRDTAAPVEKDGEPLTVEVPFTPEEADGTVEVVFRFDGSELAGRTLVAFEELRLDGEAIAEHKDPQRRRAERGPGRAPLRDPGRAFQARRQAAPNR